MGKKTKINIRTLPQKYIERKFKELSPGDFFIEASTINYPSPTIYIKVDDATNEKFDYHINCLILDTGTSFGYPLHNSVYLIKSLDLTNIELETVN